MNLSWTNAYAPLVGRILMGGMFLMAGITKAMDLSGTATYISSATLPYPMVLAVAAMLLEILCGIALIVGYQAKLAAALLAIFTIVVTLAFHLDQQALFIKNLAILAGLLYMMTFGAGKYAVGK